MQRANRSRRKGGARGNDKNEAVDGGNRKRGTPFAHRIGQGYEAARTTIG